jgi:hypothetical protein
MDELPPNILINVGLFFDTVMLGRFACVCKAFWNASKEVIVCRKKIALQRLASKRLWAGFDFKKKWQPITTLVGNYRQLYEIDFQKENGLPLYEFLKEYREFFSFTKYYAWNIFRYDNPTDPPPKLKGRPSSQ